jgi:murein DD-endopeptidase MepM/ murein hydrolase activator NlpD
LLTLVTRVKDFPEEGGFRLRKKQNLPDKRNYTLMIVPHRGNKVYRFQMPIRLVKVCAATVGVLMAAAAIGLFHYQYTINQAQAELDELQKLRSVNMAQAGQLNQLAKNTAILQEEMSKLNQLDSEVRRLLNKEEATGTSRSGVVRPSAAHAGEGGPVVRPQPEELNALVTDLQVSAKVRGESLAKLRESLVERNARLAATPSIWPSEGVITSRFGWRWGGSDWHPGIDVAADSGTPIVATAAGVVVASGWNGGYGRQVIVDHGYGITTSYAHNSENAVSVGQKVKKGQLVAYMGSSGFSTGPHVHYEVKVNGTAVNPAGFM